MILFFPFLQGQNSGITHNMNRWLLVYISLLLGTPLGDLEAPLSWNAWRGKCKACHQLLLAGGGLFCGNFSSRRGHWTPCRQAWCGPCYTVLDNREFPIAQPKDEDGAVVEDEATRTRYVAARNGDNLVTPFQCDLCHFQNLMG